MPNFRSHRIPRVVLDEAMEAAQLLRWFLAELRGVDIDGRSHVQLLEKARPVAVVDAKDTHDKVTTDTPT